MDQTALPIFDPYAVLGLDPGAEEEQIRAAYLAKLKQFPRISLRPSFEQARDAYELLRDRPGAPSTRCFQ